MARIAVKLTRGPKEWRSRKISIKQEKEGSYAWRHVWACETISWVPL